MQRQQRPSSSIMAPLHRRAGLTIAPPRPTYAARVDTPQFIRTRGPSGLLRALAPIRVSSPATSTADDVSQVPQQQSAPSPAAAVDAEFHDAPPSRPASPAQSQPPLPSDSDMLFTSADLPLAAANSSQPAYSIISAAGPAVPTPQRELSDGELSGDSDEIVFGPTASAASPHPGTSAKRARRNLKRRERKQKTEAAAVAMLGPEGPSKDKFRSTSELVKYFEARLRAAERDSPVLSQTPQVLRVAEYLYLLARELQDIEEECAQLFAKIVPTNNDGSYGNLRKAVLKKLHEDDDIDILVLENSIVRTFAASQVDALPVDHFKTEAEEDEFEEAFVSNLQSRGHTDMVLSSYVAACGTCERYSSAYNGQRLVTNVSYHNTDRRFWLIHRTTEQPPQYLLLTDRLKLLQAKYLLRRYQDYQYRPYSCPVTFVQGPPGQGKTTAIRRRATELYIAEPEAQTVIVTMTRSAKLEINKKYATAFADLPKPLQLVRPPNLVVRTNDSFHLNKPELDAVKQLLADESPLSHAESLDLIASECQPEEIVLFGDLSQLEFHSHAKGYTPRFHRFVDCNTRMEISYESYRLQPDVCALLSRYYTGGIRSKAPSGPFRSLFYRTITGIDELMDILPPPHAMDGNCVHMTFTRREKKRLIRVGYANVRTINESQGGDYLYAVLVRLNCNISNPLFESDRHITVALSRHKKSFSYYTVKEDKTYSMLKEAYSDGLL